MTNLLTIQADHSVRGPVDNSVPTRSADLTPTPVAKPVPLFVNPSFQFDATVGLVVVGFHDDKGALSSTIPSQRQLAAYRSHQATPPGEEQPLAPKPPQERDKTAAG